MSRTSQVRARFARPKRYGFSLPERWLERCWAVFLPNWLCSSKAASDSLPGKPLDAGEYRPRMAGFTYSPLSARAATSNDSMNELSHFDEHGSSRMVNVGDKPVARRIARASGIVEMAPTTRQKILNRDLSKGDVLEVARLAGIMAAKRTAELIPLCHPLALDSVALQFRPAGENRIYIEAIIEVQARTGVEMEALTAVSVSALTIYDMCKAVDRTMEIKHIQLEEKLGGASGHFVRKRHHDTPA